MCRWEVDSFCAFDYLLEVLEALSYFFRLNTLFLQLIFFTLLCEAILVTSLIYCLFWATKTLGDMQNSALPSVDLKCIYATCVRTKEMGASLSYITVEYVPKNLGMYFAKCSAQLRTG